MKKFLFMGALAAMLLGTASCSNDMEPAMGDNTVQFTIELPGAIDSRAIADGTTATQLTVAVYDKDGKHLDLDKNVVMNNKRATVTFQLVKGQEYSFAFWAQAEGAPYTFDTANQTVNVSYTDAKSNDEKRDAFYWYEPKFEITGTMTKNITLYRPFAQLNYGASDYAEAVKAGVTATTSAVTVNHAATSFNLATGETDGDQAVTFTKELLPNEIKTDGDPNPDKLVVEETQYDWMAMNYFLVPSNEAVITTNLKLYEEGATDPVRDLTVYSVPVQKNHRTNIVGNLFTEDVNFDIIIDERFDQPDLGLMSDPDEIAAAIQTPNAVVSIAPGTTLNLDLSTIAEGVTINGHNSKLILNQTTNKVNANNVKITGFTIDNNEGGGSDASIVVNGSSFNMKDCVFTPSIRHTFSVYLKNKTDDGVYNFDGIVSDNTLDRRIIGPECKGTVNISNSYLNSVVYPISTAYSIGDCDINVTNTKLIGWTSFDTGTNKTYNFENCYFGKLNYGYFRPYGGNGTNKVYVKNCTFSDDYEAISPVRGVNIYITGSKLENGNAITRALIDHKKDGSVIADGNVYVDDVQIYNGETECER